METTKTLNELLLRFDEAGKFQGAHAVYLYQTFDGDKRVSVAAGGPVPLGKLGAPDLAAIQAVCGEAVTLAAATLDANTAALAEKDAALAARAAEIAAAEAAKTAAEAAKAEAEAELAALKAAAPEPIEA